MIFIIVTDRLDSILVLVITDSDPIANYDLYGMIFK